MKIIIIISAFFLKAGSSRLIRLILAMQFIGYLSIYHVDFPAEVQIYIESVRNIAEFDILPTE